MGRYFGTDGVRGLANQDLTPELAFKLGRCVGSRLVGLGAANDRERPFVFIGRDTRRSGGMLEGALAAGFCSVGLDVWLLGVVPTPAVAWLTRNRNASAGIMISASHNPAPDNGIKVFSGEGFKLPDAIEESVEDLLDAPEDRLPRPTGTLLGQVHRKLDLAVDYVAALEAVVPEGLEGLRVAIDCAHGAASAIAPRVLAGLGVELTVLGDSPDGDNINLGVGSTHMGALIEEVVQGKHHLGLAFDGDADRCLAVDHTGQVVDGDQIMFICRRYLAQKGRLTSPDVVATVMSNLGFEEAVQADGGKVLRTRVGDRYVLEEMQKRGIQLGGEQSGHIIFLDRNTTGDGIMTGLHLMAAIRSEGQTLHDLAKQMPLYPQLLRNIRVGSIAGWQDHPKVKAAIAAAEARLVGQGRLLVRASGTEPLIRVMAEARDHDLVTSVVASLITELTEALQDAPASV